VKIKCAILKYTVNSVIQHDLPHCSAFRSLRIIYLLCAKLKSLPKSSVFTWHQQQ